MHCSDYDLNRARSDSSLLTNDRNRKIAQRTTPEVCNISNTRVHAHGGDNSSGRTCIDRKLSTSGERRNAAQRPPHP